MVVIWFLMKVLTAECTEAKNGMVKSRRRSTRLLQGRPCCILKNRYQLTGTDHRAFQVRVQGHRW
jgi:hypothetical protein